MPFDKEGEIFLLSHILSLTHIFSLLFISNLLLSHLAALTKFTVRVDCANMATTREVPTDTSSADSLPPAAEKEIPQSHVEQVHTNEKVPGHPGYYEKDGLRTYGDDEDHDHEPPVWRSALYDRPQR